QGLEREILPPGGGKVDVAAAGVKGDRLRPDPVFAGAEGWEIIVAALIGEDRSDDVGAVAAGRNRESAPRNAVGRLDGAAQHRVGSGGRHGSERRRRHGGGEYGTDCRESSRTLHGGPPD